MKRLIISTLIAMTSIYCFADEKKTTIQVSATIKPYCKLVVEKEEVKHVCPGYEAEKVIHSITTMDDKTKTITIYY